MNVAIKFYVTNDPYKMSHETFRLHFHTVTLFDLGKPPESGLCLIPALYINGTSIIV